MVDVGNDCACGLNESDMFSEIDTQVELEDGYWEDIHPLNNVSSEGPIEFTIPGLPDQFIDLNNTLLHVQVKITSPTGGALVTADDVAPVNNWLHSLFSNVDCTFANQRVEGGEHTYPYKAYLQNLLTMSKSAKETHLQTSGWYQDTSGKFDTTSNHDENLGYKTRKANTKLSKIYDMTGPLLLDTTIQNRFVLQNTTAEIKLMKSKPEFQTIIKTASGTTGASYSLKVKFVKAVLYVRRVVGTTSKILSIENQLNVQNALLPVQKTRIISYSIPAGSNSHNKESLFNGLLPKAMFVGLVDNAAYNGTYGTNPFNFQQFNLKSLTCFRNGQPYPHRPYEPDFTNGLYTREYTGLMQTIDCHNKSEDIGLSLDDWANGSTIYGFNFTPNLQIAGMAQVARDGNIRLEITFSESTAKAITVIVMGVFDGRISLTKMRNITVDWNT